MVAATVLTLIFVPVFYAVIERLRERHPDAVPAPHQDAASVAEDYEPRAEAAE
jgi:HAE1 family hydrophobic/amphiphilic exporter-1